MGSEETEDAVEKADRLECEEMGALADKWSDEQDAKRLLLFARDHPRRESALRAMRMTADQLDRLVKKLYEANLLGWSNSGGRIRYFATEANRKARSAK